VPIVTRNLDQRLMKVGQRSEEERVPQPPELRRPGTSSVALLLNVWFEENMREKLKSIHGLFDAL
jgi:hypothetical protein